MRKQLCGLLLTKPPQGLVRVSGRGCLRKVTEDSLEKTCVLCVRFGFGVIVIPNTASVIGDSVCIQ